MPKVSWESATQSEEVGPVRDRYEVMDGYSVNITVFDEDIDATPLLKNLPDDRCQCPHWGYVIEGSMTVRFPGRDEVYNAGEAFYTPPGHTPLKHRAGTQVVMFSPEEELSKTGRAVRSNAQANGMRVRTSAQQA